jgi:hypothetical protein
MTLGRLGRIGLALAAVFVLGAAPAWAQKQKPPAGKQAKDAAPVTLAVALSATREVLVKQGYEVLKVETLSDRQIVTYRAGNQGRGKGKGPPVRMVIRRVENRIVLDDAPEGLKVEIGIRLGIKL